jgi:nucleotide-binding universal stress UspA family protein
MKKILVPTDFSDLSELAIDFATEMAHNAIAEVEIVHFMNFPLDVELKVSGDTHVGSTSENDLYNLQLMQANKQKIAELNNRFKDNKIKVTGQIHGGGFLKGIEHYVKNNEIDIVVMATSGEESIQEFFTGNHAEQLIEHLNIPVITLREKMSIKDIKHVILALDVQDEPYQPWKMLHLTKRILDCFKAKIHLVNVIPHGYAFKEEIRIKLGDVAEELGLEKYEVDVIEHRDDFSGLVQYAEKIDARLICVFTHARPGINRFFQHSFAKDLTRVADLPVMVLNKRNVQKLEFN